MIRAPKTMMAASFISPVISSPELIELVPEFLACSSEANARSESGQEKVGVSGAADGQNQHANGIRQQRLKGPCCL